MAEASFGHTLPKLACKVCGEGRPRYPGQRCFDCYRAAQTSAPKPKARGGK